MASRRTFRKLAGLVRDGLIGKVTLARAYRVDNMAPKGIGRMKLRWWNDYSSQMGNWGVHYMDAIRWMIGERAPVAVSAHGGRYAVDDDRTIPDTMEVTFEMPGGASRASRCGPRARASSRSGRRSSSRGRRRRPSRATRTRVRSHFEYPFPETGTPAERRKAAVALMRKDGERLRAAMAEAQTRS